MSSIFKEGIKPSPKYLSSIIEFECRLQEGGINNMGRLIRDFMAASFHGRRVMLTRLK